MNESNLTELFSGLLGPKASVWLTAICAWVGAFRLLMKPFSAWLLSLVQKGIDYVIATKDTDDDAFVERLLRARWYRALAFLLDYVCSVKLPLELRKE